MDSNNSEGLIPETDRLVANFFNQFGKFVLTRPGVYGFGQVAIGLGGFGNQG
jgi:hypothetical protein